jgi:curved DNA-binding protein CbpA
LAATHILVDGATYHQDSNSSPFSSYPDFPSFDPYQVLRVSQSADIQSIKAAYRARAKETHPDKQQPNGGSARSSRDDSEFIQVQESYDLLVDTERRRQYDRHRRLLKIQQQKQRRQQEQKRRQEEWLRQQKRQKKPPQQQQSQKRRNQQEQQPPPRPPNQKQYSQSSKSYNNNHNNRNANSQQQQQQELVTKLIVINEYTQPINLYRLVEVLDPFHHFQRRQKQEVVRYDLLLVHENLAPGAIHTLRRTSNIHVGDVIVARDVRVDAFSDVNRSDKVNRNNQKQHHPYADSTILFRHTITSNIQNGKLFIGGHHHSRSNKDDNDAAVIDSIYTSDCYDLSTKCIEMNNKPTINCQTFPEFMNHMCRLTCRQCRRPPPISSSSKGRKQTSPSSSQSFMSNLMKASFRDVWYTSLVFLGDVGEYIMVGWFSFIEQLDDMLSSREYALLAWVMISFITGLYASLLLTVRYATICACIPLTLFAMVAKEEVRRRFDIPDFLDGFLHDTTHIFRYNFEAATVFMLILYAVGIIITIAIDGLTDVHIEMSTGTNNNKNRPRQPVTNQTMTAELEIADDVSPPIVQSSSSCSSSSNTCKEGIGEKEDDKVHNQRLCQQER